MRSSIPLADRFYSSLAADPDLREIVLLFVEEMPTRIEVFQQRCESADWEGLRQAAHQLKGAAGSYGFDPITACAARLELRLRQNEPMETILESVRELIEMCGRASASPPPV